MYHIANMTEKVVSSLDMYIATHCLAESEYMHPAAGICIQMQVDGGLMQCYQSQMQARLNACMHELIRAVIVNSKLHGYILIFAIFSNTAYYIHLCTVTTHHIHTVIVAI